MVDGNRLALIIGIDSYSYQGSDGKPSLPSLPSCKKDAEDLYNLLSSEDYGYTVFGNGPIIGSNLEKEEGWLKVHRSIKKFFNSAEPGQILLFYFSGHGIPRGEEVYLATPDVDPKDPMIEGFPLRTLTEIMDSSKSARIVCIIDACYAGAANLSSSPWIDKAAAEGDSERALATYDKILNIPKAKGKCYLLSSQAYEKSRAIENSNSLYTKYLIEGLRGAKTSTDDKGREIPASIDSDGNVTPESLHEYVYHKVANEANQVPKIKFDKASDIILATHRELVRIVPELPSTRGDIAELMGEASEYLDYGEHGKAIERYDKVIRLNPKYARAWNKKGDAFYEIKRYDDALECYDKALEIKPKYFNVLHSKGNALYKLGRYNEAIEYYDKALEISPDDSALLSNRNLAANELSKDKKSRQTSELSNVTDAPSIIDLGNECFSKGEYESAIEHYDNALKIDPEHINAWNNRGLALHNVGRYNEAIECYDKVLEIDPTDFSAWSNKGWALHQLERYEEAIECYEQALAIDPDSATASKNKELSLEKLGVYNTPYNEEYGESKLPETGGKTKRYQGSKIDLHILAQDIVSHFKNDDFDVSFSKDRTTPPSWFFIQARSKNSIFGKIAGTRKSTDILIKGRPEDFEINMKTGEWKKNLVSATLSSTPITIPIIPLTGGISLIVPAVANLYTGKRFKDSVWKLIDNKVRELR